jgi:predicted transcriptional regulator
MISVDLDFAQQKRFEELAAARGEDPSVLARQIILDYLSLNPSEEATDEEWAATSVALTPEIMGEELWNDSANG